VLLGVLAVAIYVRGFVLVGDYGLLDGEVTLPRFSVWPLLISVAIIVAATIALARPRVRQSVLGATFAVAMIANGGHLVALVVDDPKTGTEGRGGDRPLFELGDENLVVILLDALQSDVFAEVLDENPDIREAFDGFTYYRNTLGVGRSTYVALPTIHSGDVSPDRACGTTSDGP
jgi:hypothetical protein